VRERALEAAAAHPARSPPISARSPPAALGHHNRAPRPRIRHVHCSLAMTIGGASGSRRRCRHSPFVGTAPRKKAALTADLVARLVRKIRRISRDCAIAR